jgi:peptide-methionine (S)-S-oxide reductase
MTKTILFCLLSVFALSCEASNADVQTITHPSAKELPIKKVKANAIAYFASGCFWCVEAVFESVTGVSEAVSGYSGGEEKNPSYELICTGRTRHAEAVKVYYDSTIVSYETLLVVFFDSHDPSTLNQQGPDRGPQYRSAIFYRNEREKKAAEKYISVLKKKGSYKTITTEVSKLKTFYDAEDYHQDYERNHPNNSYVKAVSIPRLNTFKAKHPELLKNH